MTLDTRREYSIRITKYLINNIDQNTSSTNELTNILRIKARNSQSL